MLACLSPRLILTKKFVAWVYWKLFCRFWPFKARDFAHVVLTTLFFPVNFIWLLRQWICRRFLIKPKEGLGGRVNIIQFRSSSASFGSKYFFYFKASMLELQKSFLLAKFFNQISCNKGSKAKISCFFLCFSVYPLPPPPFHLGLESWSSRKTASFLASHRLKKYKNLHPQRFANGTKTWKMLKIANFWG